MEEEQTLYFMQGFVEAVEEADDSELAHFTDLAVSSCGSNIEYEALMKRLRAVERRLRKVFNGAEG